MDPFTKYSRRTWIWTKTMFFRITITKVTACFFLFSFLFCFAHGVVQSVLFSLDNDAHLRAASILDEAQVPRNQVAWLQSREDDNFVLKLCKQVPLTRDRIDNCELIFQSGVQPIDVPPGFRKRDDQGYLRRDSLSVQTSLGITGVEFSADEIEGGSKVSLNATCTRVLIYVDQVLNNSKREELALIGSEFWLLGISVFAIMYDSIPHLLAGFFMRVLSTGWSAYAIWRTLDIRRRFETLVTHGPCGVDLFPNYTSHRIDVQIADLVMNATALFVSCYLVWKLVKMYATCMFTRVGAPAHVLKLYKYFLGVFICLQMSVYLLVASMSLWIDQLVNGPLVNISSHNTAYLVGFTIANVLLVPWIALGWFSVRKEMRCTMIAFLFVGLFYMGGWGIMYYSLVFRWTWISWPFFASLAVAAMIVQLASIVLGVICRMNFHHGLAQYFYANNLLTRSDFEPEVFPHDPERDSEKKKKREEPQVDFTVVSIPLSPGGETRSDASSIDETESVSKVKFYI